MKSLRFLISKKLSPCCRAQALIVKSRAGGFVSQNCLKCGKSDYIAVGDLPELKCDYCKSDLVVELLDGKNYFYCCKQCNRNWKVHSVVPDWKDLFSYSGLAAGQDYLELS